MTEQTAPQNHQQVTAGLKILTDILAALVPFTILALKLVSGTEPGSPSLGG